MRVGNEEYARTNGSYCLTTLRNRHVKVEGSSRIHFDFRGKHGAEHHIDLRDKRNVVQAVEAVSKMLGNTPAICRKCYIRPAVFDGYLDGSLLRALKKRADERLANPDEGLKAEETAVMGFLGRQLAAADRVSLRQRRGRRAPTLERRRQLNTTIVVRNRGKVGRQGPHTVG